MHGLREAQLPCRSLTGARIETRSYARTTPSAKVAPSRERGSKRHGCNSQRHSHRSLPHGSADRNSEGAMVATRTGGRSLTGARIETQKARWLRPEQVVAPSRERGSKQRPLHLGSHHDGSLPHGSADRNGTVNRSNPSLRRSLPHGSADRNCGEWCSRRVGRRRSLTGARIETGRCRGRRTCPRVAPSRERGSKRGLIDYGVHTVASLPHGSADRNRDMTGVAGCPHVAPSRERGSKLGPGAGDAA